MKEEIKKLRKDVFVKVGSLMEEINTHEGCNPMGLEYSELESQVAFLEGKQQALEEVEEKLKEILGE